jgi:hypothetical protein
MEALARITARPDVRALGALMLIIVCIVVIILIVKHARKATIGIEQQIAATRATLSPYDKNYGTRKALTEIIGTPNARPAGIISNTLSLTNFYVATARSAAVADNFVSTDFLVSYIRAGARCLDFAVLPLDPTDPRSPPIICEGNPTTRTRTTANYVTFDAVCQTILQNAVLRGGSSATGLKNAGDPLFVMLRVGAGQNRPMVESMAASLQHAFAEYRLPYTYYKCARQNKIYADPIDIFMGKIIFLSDSPLKGTPMEEYINVTFVPASSSVNALQQTLWTNAQLAVLDTAGKTQLIDFAKQQLMMAGGGGAVDRSISDPMGIHFVAEDWSKVGSTSKLFTKASFALKPAALQFIPIVAPVAIPLTPQHDPKGGIISLTAQA